MRKRCGIFGAGDMPLTGDAFRTIFVQNFGTQMKPRAIRLRQRRHRRSAIGSKRREKRALGIHTGMGDMIVYRGERGAHRCIGRQRLDADGALRRRGQHHIQRDRRTDIRPVQPFEPGRRQQRRIGVARRQLRQSGIDIAAKQRDRDVRPRAAHLRRSSGG